MCRIALVARRRSAERGPRRSALRSTAVEHRTALVAGGRRRFDAAELPLAALSGDDAHRSAAIGGDCMTAAAPRGARFRGHARNPEPLAIQVNFA
ncbi:hypothetical protein sce4832 [Sorangium cellulosum So ce56]|uniref:Uncharacterized protein n=1 Tax=Sorangium cellulosum (strain So ce56) TaxID=448385 RepID=A9FFI6_SORC5|nr:hypothetical protein sce4832 [Sorangium cellulosum So ce56]